jgi:hypothetical protein
VIHEVEQLLFKCEALSSNPNTIKKKKRKRKSRNSWVPEEKGSGPGLLGLRVEETEGWSS